MQDVMDWLNTYPLFLPAFIVLARVCDVSLGTIRTIMVVRGQRAWAAVLGFFEVMVWVLAVSGVLNEITAVKVISFGLGFALGNMTGIWLEQKMAMGRQLIWLLSKDPTRPVAKRLREADYMATEISAEGAQGEVGMVFVVARRSKTMKILKIAQNADPRVFTVVEDVRASNRLYSLMMTSTVWRAVFKK